MLSKRRGAVEGFVCRELDVVFPRQGIVVGSFCGRIAVLHELGRRAQVLVILGHTVSCVLPAIALVPIARSTLVPSSEVG